MAPRSKAKEVSHKEDDVRPGMADVEGANAFAQLAKKHWLKSSKKMAKVKVKADVLKAEIWDVLEAENFAFKSLLLLENTQVLEKYAPLRCKMQHSVYANGNSYLWPGYTEDSSNYHVLLIVLIANVRTREHLPTWSKCTWP